jgi:uncharacterized membrane protein YjgN (DUF898 family)
MTNWYYKDGDTRIGPVSDEEMKELAREGRITADTMVWNEFIDRWRRYGELVGEPPKPEPAPLESAPVACSEADTGGEPFSPDNPSGAYSGETGDGGYYSAPPNAESYCNSCFHKFPTAEMISTPNGPICRGCAESRAHSLTGEVAAGPSIYKVEFTGSGKEYFKIWIVNLLLSIVTLGIYSAWAKVRRNKYFYRNTRIAGSSFDYHGRPLAILKGRLIAVALLAALFFSKQFSVELYLVALLVVAIVLPWLIARSFAFRLYNTSWRGIRMRFHGSVIEAYSVALIYGFLTIISLGLCFPLFYRQMRIYFMNNAAFGTTKAELDVSVGNVYGVFVKTGLISFLLAILTGLALTLFFKFAGAYSFQGGRPSRTMIIFMVIVVMAMYLLYRVIVQSFFRTRMTNLMWEHTRVGILCFESHQRARDLSSIIASNAILTFLTLGFYWPWAKMQLAKYYADTLLVHAPEGFGNFIADFGADVAATGDEVTEALDVDFSF